MISSVTSHLLLFPGISHFLFLWKAVPLSALAYKTPQASSFIPHRFSVGVPLPCTFMLLGHRSSMNLVPPGTPGDTGPTLLSDFFEAFLTRLKEKGLIPTLPPWGRFRLYITLTVLSKEILSIISHSFLGAG